MTNTTIHPLFETTNPFQIEVKVKWNNRIGYFKVKMKRL